MDKVEKSGYLGALWISVALAVAFFLLFAVNKERWAVLPFLVLAMLAATCYSRYKWGRGPMPRPRRVRV